MLLNRADLCERPLRGAGGARDADHVVLEADGERAEQRAVGYKACAVVDLRAPQQHRQLLSAQSDAELGEHAQQVLRRHLWT